MVALPNQPDIFRRPDLPAFDGLPQLDQAFCGALRVARTLGDTYATEGLNLEEVLEPPQRRGPAARGFIEMPRILPRQRQGSNRG